MKRLAAPMNIKFTSGVEFRTEYDHDSVHMIGLFSNEYTGVNLNAEYLKENIMNPLDNSRTVLIKKGREHINT